jgi:hypothetical protein
MTDRERWIVYPLLFLTLGIALRNQFLPTRRFGAVDLRAGELSAQRVVCKELITEKGECLQQFQFNEALAKHIGVLGLLECIQLKAANAECGGLVIADAEGRPVILAGADKNTQSGVIQTKNRDGMPLVQLGATEGGGAVTTAALGGKVLLQMGQEGQNIGVFANFPQIHQSAALTLPLRIDLTPTIPKSSQTPSLQTPTPSAGRQQQQQPQQQQSNPPPSGNTP